MKPWPEALLKRYPLSPTVAVWGLRPWWQYAPMSVYLPGHDPTQHPLVGRARYVRRDGVELRGAVAERVANGDTMVPAEIDEALAAIDAHEPLPHPGFRVGQVWATEGGVARLVTTDPLTVKGSALRYLVHDTVCPWLAPWSPS